MVSSKSNEWATPQDFYDELHREFGFTLDPCSTIENHKCEKYYTIRENGLLQNWSNEVVFMNPPYGGQTANWIIKAYEESRKGATVVCLITSSTDRSYWHSHIFPFAAQIRFIRGRLKFGGVKESAPFASAVVIFTEQIKFNERIYYYTMSVSEARKMKQKSEPRKEGSLYDV